MQPKTTTEHKAHAQATEIYFTMTDSERLDKLESLLLRDERCNGLALFPSRDAVTNHLQISIQDLGDEDGSNLGEELTDLHTTLRAAIDDLP